MEINSFHKGRKWAVPGTSAVQVYDPELGMAKIVDDTDLFTRMKIQSNFEKLHKGPCMFGE